MPTYEYECKSCKRTFEVQHSIKDPAPATCEACSGELRRVFYPPGLVFKGTGFYSTDGRFGRTADKRETFKQEEQKTDAAAASKEPATAASSKTTDAKPSGAKPSGASASAEKSA